MCTYSYLFISILSISVVWIQHIVRPSVGIGFTKRVPNPSAADWPY